ncbi:hypothetical protein [Qipengyuania aquimaris]|uniref:hypothetical protein n=1 Tax=Qipengyuania aquimaris TaxID=255984 RepID=UPI001CD5C76E|nr:hypothetical protein [Qipengyuania aquimaris]MCA0902732.1 hypothetical protein [Qipengyuania aquimaris]
MSELVAEQWPLILVALLIGIVVAFYLFRSTRRTRVTGAKSDVLDEGADKAHRNAALIDSAPAAAKDPAVPTTPSVAKGTGGDDLTRIKGVGPKLAATLGELGVTRFDQIAAWDDAEIERVDAQLGRFQGRIRRDDWVGQAALLAGGDTEAFKQKYGSTV